MLGGSTFRRALAIALIAWAPGAIVVTIAHTKLSRFHYDAGRQEIDFLEEELFEMVREHQAEDALLGDRIVLEPGDDSFYAFLARYVRQIKLERRQATEPRPALDYRLALLGESKVKSLPVEAVVSIMLDEVPDEFHESLLELVAFRADAYDDVALAREVTTEALLETYRRLDDEEEVGECALLRASDGRILASTYDEVLRERRPGRSLRLLQVVPPEEIEDEKYWCLVRERSLQDGGRLKMGMRFDDQRAVIASSRLLRNLVLYGGVPLAFFLAWLQTRFMRRFLYTLRLAAGQQAKGDIRARLRTRSLDPDLATAARTINVTLDQLGHTVQALTRVGDSIAHDLRTPLSRLQGQLDLLRRRPDPELIDSVQAEADQILGTFNALLRIAQVESGVKKQGFRHFDFAETVADVAELYAPVFAEKGVEFLWREATVSAEKIGDRDLWLQALSNLVENALKYTPKGGQVELVLEPDGDRHRIVLRDSGPGIPETERENVFRRFYRLERHRGERGNGLGLSLVAAVCDLHDATVTLGGELGLTVEIVY
ncbi:MAG: HAMP domain-containing sensor histidine kinase [Acidobacteriota bacterium]